MASVRALFYESKFLFSVWVFSSVSLVTCSFKELLYTLEEYRSDKYFPNFNKIAAKIIAGQPSYSLSEF